MKEKITISEAIKCLVNFEVKFHYRLDVKEWTAIRLSIEALRREQTNRINPAFIICGKLQGESDIEL